LTRERNLPPNASVHQPSLVTGLFTSLAFVSFCSLSEGAHAASNDVDLTGLITRDQNGAFTSDDAAFRALSRELGLVMTPTSLQPAETTGHSGFDFGIDYAFHSMRYNEAYWTSTRASTVPVLMTLGVRARKGFVLPLPLSSEIEFGTHWLVDSQLLNLGTNLRVALNEGFRFIPDIAIQGGVNRVVGNKDFDLVTAIAGGQVSKGFGISGTFNFTPYVGYQSVWVNGSSRIIDANPSDTENTDDNVVFLPALLLQNRMDRLSAGARIVIAVVHVSGGLDMDFVEAVSGTNTGGAPEVLLQYGVRAGVTF